MGRQMVRDAKKVSKTRDIFRNEDGFTTLTVAVSMLLVLVLIVNAAQIRWVQSESADIQFAADSAALASENVVAEFYVFARAVDAIVLSLSLLSLSMFAVATVLCCIPPLIPVGEKLMQLGFKVSDARNRFADSATKALDAYQKAIPVICVISSASVVSQNSDLSPSASYIGFAIPLPISGEVANLVNGMEESEAIESMEESNVRIGEDSEKAREAHQAMKDSKARAYMADCGNSPNYCMYQRAQTLAGMSGATNPFYSSEELWSFSTALNRAKSYYSHRLAIETPLSGSVLEQVNSNCRKVFYRFAIEQLQDGYVIEGEDGAFDANFPLLPKNTSEMRKTHIFTDAICPVARDSTIHGYASCPHLKKHGQYGFASLSQYESGVCKRCPVCEFTTGDMGKVGAPSSTIGNGFEYYYRIVAEEAQEYERQSKIVADCDEQTREYATDSFETYGEALKKLTDPSKRYNPKPPGRHGSIAVVVDTQTHSAPLALVSGLLGQHAKISPRIAISAAALATDEPQDGNTIISSMLDSIVFEQSNSPLFLDKGMSWLLGIWSGALEFYGNGIEGLRNGIEKALGSVQMDDGGSLGKWASDALMTLLDSLGIAPMDLSTPKPVIVNSVHVLSQESTSLSDALELVRAINGVGVESSI